ncbi:MAG: carboxypeptidase-like regulatory domain-containing protein [Planctomycetota bacterium]
MAGFIVQMDSIDKRKRIQRRGLVVEGTYEGRFALADGSYTVTVTFPGWGSISRSCVIASGQTTNLVLSPDDKDSDGQTVIVDGSLRYPDGTSIVGARLLFRIAGPGSMTGNFLRTTTDTQGRFRVDGLTPGLWDQPRVRLSDGSQGALASIVVPETSTGVYRLDLVMPAGKIIGWLYDGFSGDPFSEGGPEWSALLIDDDSGKTVCARVAAQMGPELRIAGVPSGRYRVRVDAYGYFPHECEPCVVDESQVRELGDLRLDPAGVLDLTIVTPAGDPVESFRVMNGSKPLGSGGRRRVSKDTYRWQPLPIGPLQLTVEADGYVSTQVTVNLPPARVTAAQVILSPR